MRLQPIIVAFVALSAFHAHAQIGNPGFMAPDTQMEKPGVAAPNQTNTQDRLFAQLVGEGGRAEVALGKLAADKAAADAVKAFAERMRKDHGNANDKLASVAKKNRIPLPADLNAEHTKMREQLESLDGAAFDLAYLRGQIVDHQKTIQLLTWQIDWGQDPELKRFSAETLPIVLDHLTEARAILADLAQGEIDRTAGRR